MRAKDKAKGPTCFYQLYGWFLCRKSWPFKHEHEKLTLFLVSFCGPQTSILLPVLEGMCHWPTSFGRATELLCLWWWLWLFWTAVNTQVKLWPKMAQKLFPQVAWKEWSQHKNWKNTGRFWHNLNTRLIVYFLEPIVFVFN